MKVKIKNIRNISVILILLYAWFFVLFFMKHRDFSQLVPTLIFLGVTLLFGAGVLFLHLRFRCPHCHKLLKSMLYHRPSECSHCLKEIDWED